MSYRVILEVGPLERVGIGDQEYTFQQLSGMIECLAHLRDLFNACLHNLYLEVSERGEQKYGDNPRIGWVSVEERETGSLVLDIVLRSPSRRMETMGYIDLKNREYALLPLGDEPPRDLQELYEDTRRVLRSLGLRER